MLATLFSRAQAQTSQYDTGELVTLAPHQSQQVSFVFGVYDSRSYTSAQLTSRHALEQYLLTQGLANLAAQHAGFISALPRTGDAQLDVYLRWYLSAAVLLTKGISTGEVLTMGYAELNQRDSYWNSGAHLTYQTLNRRSKSPFGVHDTYPYIPTSFKQEDYGPGEYHNGGIWPWLNFADAWGHFLNGHDADAVRILKEVGYYDLVSTHDFLPNEFLNGESGKNEGEAPQGWDADFFSAIYFGAFGLNRVSANQLNIHINLPANDNFTTTIRLPEGNIQLIRAQGKLRVTKNFASPLIIKESR